MIGIVAGLFCTLCVAGLCTYFFKFDAKWYASLIRPAYVLSGGWFTLMVSASYLSSVMSIGRLVQYKHLFPSMLFFLGVGVCEVLFTALFFTCKELIGAFVFSAGALAFAYVLLIRFFMKDIKLALEFLPKFLFLSYAFICMLEIVMKNG